MLFIIESAEESDTDNVAYHNLRCHQVSGRKKQATITSHFIISVAPSSRREKTGNDMTPFRFFGASIMRIMAKGDSKAVKRRR